MLEDYRGIPREAKYLIYGSFFPSLAFGMLFTDLAYFLTKVQGLPDVFMGTVIMTMGITMVVASIPIGIIADRHGRRKVLIVGNIIASLVMVIFAITSEFVLLLVGAILEGISESAFSSSMNAVMAEKAGNEKRTAAFSFSFFMSSVAFGLGGFAIPLVFVFEGIGLSNREAHVILYLVLSVLSLASTLVLLKVGESKNLHKARGIGSLLPRKSKGVLIRYIITGSTIAFGAGMVVPLMTRWFDLKYGVSDTMSGPILGISSFLLGATALAAPALAKRTGVVKSIVITQGLSTVFMFAVPFSPSFLIASGIYIVRSFLMNLSNPLEQSLIMGLVAEDERGAASGISSALWRLPNSISTTIGAGLMGAGLLAEPFYLATVLYIASITIFWFAFSKIKLPEEMNLKADNSK